MKKQFVIKNFAETKHTGWNGMGLPYYFGGDGENGISSWSSDPLVAKKFDTEEDAIKALESEEKRTTRSSIYEIVPVYSIN
jgi:hypothetical protein